jgi:hypothetical protein
MYSKYGNEEGQAAIDTDILLTAALRHNPEPPPHPSFKDYVRHHPDFSTLDLNRKVRRDAELSPNTACHHPGLTFNLLY